MSVTAPQGFRAAGIAAGIKDGGRLDLALVVNDGPRPRRRRACSPATRSRPRPCCGRSRCSPAARCGPSSSTPAAPTRAPGPEGFQTTHATAEKAAEVLGCGADRGRGLLHRPDRRAAAARRPARRGREGRRGGAGRRRRGGHRRRHRGDDHRHRRQAGRVVDPAGWRVGGFAKGAGHDRPGHGHDARRAHHRRRRSTPPRCDAALRAAVGVTLRPARHRRRHVHQRHRPAAGLRRVRRRRPSAAELHRRADRGLHGPVPAAAGRRRGRHQARSPSPCSGAAAEADAVAVARTRGAGQPVQDRVLRRPTRTGAGSPMAVGRAPRRASTRSGWTSRSTASLLCRDGAAAGDRHAADLSGRDIDVAIELGLGDGAGGDPHHRPVARLRRGEQCLLLLTSSSPARRRRRPSWPRRCRGCSASTARSWWSSTAATRWSTTQLKRRSPRTWCSCGSPASARSSCTAAARRSPRCSTGSACPASSAAACASPRRRRSTSCAWCWSARSAGSSSG